eukprot:1793715-Amphidinium_carterae.1
MATPQNNNSNTRSDKNISNKQNNQSTTKTKAIAAIGARTQQEKWPWHFECHCQSMNKQIAVRQCHQNYKKTQLQIVTCSKTRVS